MVIRIVKLGSDRAPDEGTRIGTVRRPPSCVPKTDFASGNWYDVWYPEWVWVVRRLVLPQYFAGFNSH